MFDGVKPFDWLMLGIEVAVLIAIVYEIAVSHLRHRVEAGVVPSASYGSPYGLRKRIAWPSEG
jgi:hypothetical protein